MLKLLLGFVPGGGIVSLLGSIFSVVAKLIGWLVSDIADAFKEPHRLVVRVLCGLAILGVGIKMGHEDKAKEVVKWRSAFEKVLKDAEIADAKNKADVASALKAGRDAVAAERAKIAAEKSGTAVAAPAPAKRVRSKQRAAKNSNGFDGPGLPSLQALFGGSVKTQ